MNARVWAYIGARLAAAAVFLLTWAYGATTLSPFAFDMFVRPRLFPWLEDFVNWHHVWFGGAFAASAVTLVPLLRERPAAPASPAVRAAWWAALSYIVVVGLAAAYLFGVPRLRLLTSGARDLLIVPGALVPMLWLGLIDHLACADRLSARVVTEAAGQRRLVVAGLVTAACLWAAALIRQQANGPAPSDTAFVLLGAAWSLGILVTAFSAAVLLLVLFAQVAGERTRPGAWEYALAIGALALCATEFLRRIVFPPLLLSPSDAMRTAIPLGAALALTFGGLRLRAAQHLRPGETGLDLLLACRSRPRMCGLTLAAVLFATEASTTVVERLDWAMIVQRLVASIGAAAAFAAVLGLTRGLQRSRWSWRLLVAPPALALAAVHLIPLLAVRAIGGATPADPERMLDHYRASQPLTSLAARALIAQPETAPDFYRNLLAAEARLAALTPQPSTRAAPPMDAAEKGRTPHVFLFVIDSLRRDYLGAYNPEATFTPAITAWAREQFVFRNAFTQYGGTWLSMPAIWTGAQVTRRWPIAFPAMNALEPLVARTGFDFVINDYTISDLLDPGGRRTFLDPAIPSVDTDLCTNLGSLRRHIDTRETTRPIFAYLAPMNVHILNTRSSEDHSGGDHPGFMPAYASRMQRLDGCFGDFIAYLKARDLYDQSIVILTSDHGDSLGEEGRWGHQFYLYPEDIRIPLIVQLPADRRSAVTADLGRIAFLTDLTPTLQSLLGAPVSEPAETGGSPLFVPSTRAPSGRRRGEFLVMSSYGSSYGLLRRNGRLLYIVDLVNRREEAFTLYREPLGDSMDASEAVRRVNQQGILRGLETVERSLRTARSPE